MSSAHDRPRRADAGTDALGSAATSSTSSLRTYRYARLALLAAVLLLAVGVAWQLAVGGPLRSISASYYTPVRAVLTGSLLAVGVALAVLAGRSLRRFLLLLAGMVAPVIAFVPPPLPSAELVELTGTGCAAAAERCLPPGAAAEVAGGMTAYLATAGATLITALVLLRLDGALDRWAVLRCGVAAALLGAGASWFAVARPSFELAAHLVAAVVFFLLIAAVAAVHAVAVRSEGVGGPGGARLYSRCYAALAVLIGAVDVGLVVLLVTGSGEAVLGEAWLLIGEAVALALFAAFWLLQTIENWDEPNAALR